MSAQPKRGTPMLLANSSGDTKAVSYGGAVNGGALLFDAQGKAFLASAVYENQFQIQGEWWLGRIAEDKKHAA